MSEYLNHYRLPGRYLGLLLFSVILILIQIKPAYSQADVKSFTVKTYDRLELPAQVTKPVGSPKKTLLFINGSTPYDEKGNLGTDLDKKGRMIPWPHDFYQRFIRIMTEKGYSVATMAKRSYVYPQSLPRPNFADLAIDIRFFINALLKHGIIQHENELIVVGYSEGSVVATKVLGLLKNQPEACILLGPGGMAFNYDKQPWEEWYSMDQYRKKLGWTDTQLQEEYMQISQIQKTIQTMDEVTFEKEYKNSKPFGFGFAPWESIYIDREFNHYDPKPNLIYSNIPILICVGTEDESMPFVMAENIYKDLIGMGSEKVNLKPIEGEVHQYKKYDVYAIIDTWIETKYTSTDFVLTREDSLLIHKYIATNELVDAIKNLGWSGEDPQKKIECYKKALEVNINRPDVWFDLGIKLFACGLYDEAYQSFSNSTDMMFLVRYCPYVWMGHMKDIKGERKEAIGYYKTALKKYKGIPVQHDQWNIKLDKKWIRERLVEPFRGFQ